jgi:hypothetical protein
MTEWKWAMLAIIPFLRGREMVRTWAVMFTASMATFVIHTPVGYMAIDAVAAALVMVRPAGLPQRLIGALFVGMLMFDLGFYLSPGADQVLFNGILTGIGWLQWAILGAWTGHDIWRNHRVGADAADGVSVARQGRS